MKFSLAVLLVFGLTAVINSTPIKKNLSSLQINLSLHDDLQDFLALIDTEKVTEIFYEYVEHDDEVQSAIEFIGSNEFKQLIQTIEGMDDVVKFYAYLQESGLDVYKVLNKFHDMIDLPPYKPKAKMIKITGGVNGLIQDIKSVLPVEKIKALYYEKLETSEDFKKLVERLQSGKLQEIVNTMLENEVVINILNRVKEAGINVEAVADVLATMFGLEFPSKPIKLTRSLYIEFEDFLDVIQIEKIEEIALTYVAEDEGIQEVLEYTKTPDFRDLVRSLEEIYDVREFLQYLDESGVDVYDLINELHLYVGLPQYVPSRRFVKSGYGVSGLLKDVLNVIPINDVKALYYEKVETDQQFAYLHERLTSPKFQEFIEKILANEKILNSVSELEDFGVDIDEVFEIVDSFIVDNFSPLLREEIYLRNVEDDIKDIFGVIPVLKVAQIGMRYLAQDREVQEAAEYLKSQEFKGLLVKLQNEKDIYNVLKFVEESGVDVFKTINLFNEILDVPAYPKPEILMLRKSGVQGMLNEVRAILPYAEIKKKYEEKLNNSEEFKFFINRFKSPEFKHLIDVLGENNSFIELCCEAAKHGINLQHISDLITDILEIELPQVPNCQVL
ncbi:uncharacterized protein LOC122856717 [Aphidius gifuensis]|uniref:uncharacterized protein LOC122856717 n=1 Tax=Aphidius gifuensis TaxID=684658 RepID=UPI001CDCDE4B|nr:uncharacterized protein LOC122856717 [Aphidius gifuensis]